MQICVEFILLIKPVADAYVPGLYRMMAISLLLDRLDIVGRDSLSRS